jgi:predicted GIY-YIG superfamily endonuclease
MGRRRRMAFYVCIVASDRNGTISSGSTDDLSRRIWDTRPGPRDGGCVAAVSAQLGVSTPVSAQAARASGRVT